MSSNSLWHQMMSRCYDPLNPKYERYGGRGIRVCDRWICSRLFYEDMGDRPEGKTLNRIDNDGNYEPSNCEWATHETQARNRNNNRNITFNGKTQCLEAWARETGIRRETLSKRFTAGWDLERALTMKPSPSNRTGEFNNENNIV